MFLLLTGNSGEIDPPPRGHGFVGWCRSYDQRRHSPLVSNRCGSNGCLMESCKDSSPAHVVHSSGAAPRSINSMNAVLFLPSARRLSDDDANQGPKCLFCCLDCQG